MRDQKGGPGSGNHGHAGRPGKVGGSAPSMGHGLPHSAMATTNPGGSWRTFSSEVPDRTRSYGNARDVDNSTWDEADSWGEGASHAARSMRESGGPMVVTHDDDGRPSGMASYHVEDRGGKPAVMPDYAIGSSGRSGWHVVKALAKEAVKVGGILVLSTFISQALFPSNFMLMLDHMTPSYPGPNGGAGLASLDGDLLRGIADSRVA